MLNPFGQTAGREMEPGMKGSGGASGRKSSLRWFCSSTAVQDIDLLSCSANDRGLEGNYHSSICRPSAHIHYTLIEYLWC
jgi:hypothetical protein